MQWVLKLKKVGGKILMILYSSEFEVMPTFLGLDQLLVFLIFSFLYMLLIIITKRYRGVFQQKVLLLIYVLIFLGSGGERITSHIVNKGIFNAFKYQTFNFISGEVSDYKSINNGVDTFNINGEVFRIYNSNPKKNYYTGLKRESGLIDNGENLKIRYVSYFGSNYIVQITQL